MRKLVDSLSLVILPLLLPSGSALAVVPWTLLVNTNNVINVTAYGAVNDGVATNTTAINAERLLRRAHVDRLPVAVQHQHNRYLFTSGLPC